MQDVIKISLSLEGTVFIDDKINEEESRYIKDLIKDNLKSVDGLFGINENTNQDKIDSLITDIQNDFYCTKLYDTDGLFHIGIVEPFKDSSFTYSLRSDNERKGFYHELYLSEFQMLHDLDFINAVKKVDTQLYHILNDYELKLNYDFKQVSFEEIDASLKGLDMISPMSNETLVLIEENRWNIYNSIIEEVKYDYYGQTDLNTIIKDRLLDIADWYGSYFPLKIDKDITTKEDYINSITCLNYIMNVGNKYLTNEEMLRIQEMKNAIEPFTKEALNEKIANSKVMNSQNSHIHIDDYQK